ncbi:uncharacterized protein PMUG01_01031100 [Plasmodium malariae]|uniref:PIR Superfamily Protein n=1 Tax=Plasmodium malariae TaxID=5858 RepID=A0A1A8WUS3_PLAMA|nr:uncharacterized protein PMUG01_01031100 [Plasmodium malariae]SBS95605.1 PIR Superfamily Protein [Plasmodium malariae]SBT87014.1 hypothetical protein PMUG01_01031100 [Plasmodium malariae]
MNSAKKKLFNGHSEDSYRSSVIKYHDIVHGIMHKLKISNKYRYLDDLNITFVEWKEMKIQNDYIKNYVTSIKEYNENKKKNCYKFVNNISKSYKIYIRE